MRILCVSDAHLFTNTADREKTLVDVLRREEYDELILMGDIYDFWFEYSGFIPSYAIKLTSEIVRMADSKKVYFLSGNHDAWVGKFWEGLGVSVYRLGFEKLLWGKRVFFTHGDYFFGGKFSRTIRKIFHSPISISLFKLIPVEISLNLARFLSYESRKRNEEVDMRKIEDVVSRLDYEVVVSGHLHKPIIKDFNGKVFVCVGDWMENFTYLIIQDGKFSIMNREGKTLANFQL
jgi:Uncharacterized protein conserved in bacteria